MSEVEHKSQQLLDAQPPATAAGTVGPVSFAIGIAVLLVGLVVNPFVLVPVGGAIALVAGVAWVRSNRRTPEPEEDPPPPAAEADPSELRVSRNRLLERATVALGGVIALGVGLPTAGFAVLPSLLGSRRRFVDLGPLASFPEGKFVVATFLSDPRAGEVSRRAAYVRNNGVVGRLPSFTIMSSRCTHVGCPTQPNGPVFIAQRKAELTDSGEVGLVPTQPAGFGCPCHGSQFDVEGNRTAGPAPRALDRYEFSIRNGRLVLGRLYSVSRVDGAGAQARIHSAPLQGAGQPISGPESFLYPLVPPS
jgi:cytochrome b6-f complex iron-sulfur subunit